MNRPRGKDELTEVIRRSIAPGTHVITDQWGAYMHLDRAALGMTHASVCHRREFVSLHEDHTQRIESLWNALQRFKRATLRNGLVMTRNGLLFGVEKHGVSWKPAKQDLGL